MHSSGECLATHIIVRTKPCIASRIVQRFTYVSPSGYIESDGGRCLTLMDADAYGSVLTITRHPTHCVSAEAAKKQGHRQNVYHQVKSLGRLRSWPNR